MIRRFVCGAERREAVLERQGARWRVTVDGKSFSFDLRAAGPGTYVLRQDERVETFHCVRDGQDIHLFWRATVYRLHEESETPRAAERASAPGALAGLTAPMPGRVVAVRAAVGERVTRGQEILVVESMKMENAIRAPREGTVKKVAAAVGDMVAAGAV